MKRFLAGFLAGLCVTGTWAEQTDLELVAQQGVAYFFTASKPWIQDRSYLEKAARNFCHDKPICRTHFWEKGTAKPRGYPMSDKEVATEVASYQQNRNTKLSKMHWSCKAFTDLPKAECFN